MLKLFYTVQALMDPATGVTRIAGLEAFRAELDDFEHSLPRGLRLWSENKTEMLPIGLRKLSSWHKLTAGSFHLSLCGVQVITNRLIVESLTDRPGPHTAMALNNALIASERLSEILFRLTLHDRAMFWMPCGWYQTATADPSDSSYHASNAASLLLRIALYDVHTEFHVRQPAVECTVRLIDWLAKACPEATCDIAGSALRRIAPLLLIASRELPHLHDTYLSVAKILNLPISSGLTCCQRR